MTLRPTLPTLVLMLVSSGLNGQKSPATTALKPTAPTAAPANIRPMVSMRPLLKAELLTVGKTQGTFHLTGLVRRDKTVLLRWANDAGEMPTEGVRVYRQKVGEKAWKEITKKPVGFLQGKAAEKRLESMPTEERERILSYPFADIQHDPGTRLRQLELAPVAKGGVARLQDLTPEKSLQKFRELRATGRLSRHDLQLMHLRADLDTGMAELLGLTFTDDPGKGLWHYKIVVNLPEGGSAEAICPKSFNPLEPTPIPQPISLSAASGNGEVLLNWDEAPSDAVTGFNVYRAESAAGPWRRINEDPVKRVKIELEDPELTVRKSLGLQAHMERMLKPLPESARTEKKVNDAYQEALGRIAQPGGLPELSPAASKAVKEAVAAGRLKPGGMQAPASIYTDSRRNPGNTAFLDERTYFYKVTAVDLGGLEQSLDNAPMVSGTPKDLEAPQVPGKPHLKAEASALAELRTAQAGRLKDTRLISLDQALVAARPKLNVPLTPFQQGLGASVTAAGMQTAALGAGPSVPTLAQSELSRQFRSRTVATLPVGALQKVAEATVLRSLPDGSVPAANLVWDPSPDTDLKGYAVYRAEGNGPLAKVAETPAPEWTDTTLQVGVAYRYAICAVDKLGNQSGRSGEGRVEVSDSSLPGRLAIATLASKVTQDQPLGAGIRRLFRPLERGLMPSGLLKAGVATVKVAHAAEPVVAEYQAPKAMKAPKAGISVFAKTAQAAPKAKSSAVLVPELTPLKASAFVKPVFKVLPRGFNPMLAVQGPSKELHVVLEWAKPVQGFPMEYVIQQAAPKMEFVAVKRPVSLQAGIRSFEVPRTTLLAPGGSASPKLATAAALNVGSAPQAGLLAATPALHALAAKGRVGTQGGGLKLSEARKDHMARYQVATGPGVFSRVNDTPISTERYVVSFPAEVAQYGGATFYFRIQAFTREFGRLVEGPLSAPIEVRLPDIVPPPSPAVGASDLQEGAPGRVDVALSWTQTSAKDLVGVLVDRQTLSYTLVEGEAKPGAPLGAPERLTASAVAGLAFQDKQAPGGFQRYTLRAVDATGNVSEAVSSLDVLVPGEAMPSSPSGLSLAGGQLLWKAAPEAAGYTVWRSFTGEDDWECISGILPAAVTSFSIPAEGTLHLRVMARSASGMNTASSAALVRKP